MTALNQFIERQRDDDRQAQRPLSGKRVLDLSSVVAAPFAAALLGDAGADVIKIEAPKNPDPLRQWQRMENNIEPYHAVIGRHKYPITLNLKSLEGREIFLRLIEQADVLIENLRLGAMERLGLGHEVLLQRNPGLIIGKVSGYGMTGNKAAQPGFGTLAEAFSGFTYLNGCSQNGPACPPNALADLTTGVHLAHAIGLALIKQKRGVAGGQVIDISLYEPLFGYLGGDYLYYHQSGESTEPLRNQLRAAAPRNVYQSKDGHWLALSCSSQATWEKLAHAMQKPELIADSRFSSNENRIEEENRQALNSIISDWMKTKSKDALLALFTSQCITAGPIMTLADISQDIQYASRDSICSLIDPATGIEIAMPNLPYRVFGTNNRVRFPGLPTGSGNKIIFQELLNISESEQNNLKERQVV